MAQARLEKFGTIYTRVSSLLRAGAMNDADKPLWYVVYEAFPPKYEPRYDRVVPKIQIKGIYYEEDIIRARFHKDCTKLGVTDLLKHKNYQSQTQKFLDEYNDLRKVNLSKDVAYEQTLEKYTTKSQHIKQD
ncbi:hypothetical protein KPH14_012213 [Odynerus spinipes]|uniref:Small ribosomal subunit protein mS23 n=1 Tax=Odynerus spinipes TaxID=1348599 RepID=A0AAD9VLY4_9HYME|nr:hypothetical protein KPH14_012213 [Odynerus spinipes]